MDFVGAIKAGFQNYVVFKGTATRSEFWYWVLFTTLVGIVTSTLDASGTISTAFSLATLLPNLAVTVRRLRDAGFSWTWLILPIPGMVPFVYGLVRLLSEFQLMGIDFTVFENPDLIDEAFVREITANPAVVDALGIILLSLVYILLTSLVVNVILPAQKSKSFEQGNKRVAPKSPEFPVI